MSQPQMFPVLPAAPSQLQHQFQHAGLTWIDLQDPRQEQLDALQRYYQFHPLNLEDVLSRNQRPKIDDNADPEYLFLVLHFPVFDVMQRLSTISEVDIFVGDNFVVTVHDGKLRPLRRLVELSATDVTQTKVMGRGPGFLLYTIIETLVNTCFPMLYKLDAKLDQLDLGIFKKDVQATVEELSYLRRDIISLRRIVRPNIPVLHSLAKRDRPFLRLDEDAYFGDLADGLSKIWDMLEEQKEIIEGLDSTLGSLTSHRINQEMKIFTLISVIILPMTLVASILGMNVFIPLADHPLALPITLLIMLMMAFGLYLYFRYRHWV